MDNYNQIFLDKTILLKNAKELLMTEYDTTNVSDFVIELIDTAFDCGVKSAINAARMFVEHEENMARLKLRQPLEDIELTNKNIFKISHTIKP